MLFELFSLQGEFVLLFTRLVLGVVMFYYGLPKIKDLSKNAKNFEGMGFKPGMFWGTIVALLEFFGGIAMILGILTSVIAILFGLEMIGGTIWKVTKTEKPFSDYSYDIILLSICLIIITFGPGLYAIVSS